MPEASSHHRKLYEPVERIATDPLGDEPQAGTALCLSGGGYRAMLFHLGSVWRLYEAGELARLDRISSVSGGSITAGVLGMNWHALGVDAPDRNRFIELIVDPVRKLAGRTIDVSAILRGLFWFGSANNKLEHAYRKVLFGDKTTDDLPDHPRFIFNATNVQTGALWRFSKSYMGDWRVGTVKNPATPLALAAAASSAFPPVLSPMIMNIDEDRYEPDSGYDLHKPPYTTRVVLSDGGVYDNLGLETAWKRYRRVLVSDAGGQMPAQPRPSGHWGAHLRRVLDLVDNQVRSLRKRQLIESYISGKREGAYWGIRANIDRYGQSDSLPCPHQDTLKLANTSTRLAKTAPQLQEQLINWGYAICDTALRKHAGSECPAPEGFPYPESGI